jgi:hypothetical protein
MANPPIFQPGFSYSNWQVTNPTRPLPGQQVDNDFANAARSINQGIAAIADIRRSDGKLKNGIVTADSLAPALSLGFSFEGSWQAGSAYNAGDGVVFDQVFYAARVSHTASVSNQPPASEYWTLLFSLEDIVVAGALSMPSDSFASDGVTTEFDLSFTPISGRNLIVTVGGQLQATTEYGVNGNTLIFDVAPPVGAEGESYAIEVRGFATTATATTPLDGSVTNVKLSNEAVDEAKVTTSIRKRLFGYQSLADAAASVIPAVVLTVATLGYAAAGDQGGAEYTRVLAEPAHTGKFQDLSGAWFELSSKTVTPKMVGAKGDGITDDTTALNNALAIGRPVDLGWGTYRVTNTIYGDTPGQRIFAEGYPRVGNVAARSAVILVDNAALDKTFWFRNTNTTCMGFRVTSTGSTTAEGFWFERPAGSASDIDARLINVSIEGLSYGVTVRGRGLHVKSCEFGNLVRGVALDWPASWTPNGQSNDLQETGARSYKIENSLFHGTATWIENVGLNKQNIRSIVSVGNLGDLGGCPFRGPLVESVIDGSVANTGSTSGTLIDLQAGSRNSTIIGARVGGILEGAANRLPNNCVNIETTTANPTRDITLIGAFGPCQRNAVQLFGEGQMLGIKMIGASIDRAARTAGGGYCPISVFNSGGTLTKVELAVIGCSVDLTGSDSTYVIGGTNTTAVEVTWIGNQIRGLNVPIAQNLVRVFQSGADTNPEQVLYSKKNGTWATDGSEWFGRLALLTNDTNGGGVGIAGAWTLLPQTSTGAGAFWRASVSNSSNRNVPIVDVDAGGMKPVTDIGFDLGASTLRFKLVYAQNAIFTPPATVTPVNNGEVMLQFTSNTQLTFKVKGSDGTVRSGNITLS